MLVIALILAPIITLSAVAFLIGTWVVCEWLGLNEVTHRKKEAEFDEANEYKNNTL